MSPCFSFKYAGDVGNAYVYFPKWTICFSLLILNLYAEDYSKMISLKCKNHLPNRPLKKEQSENMWSPTSLSSELSIYAFSLSQLDVRNLLIHSIC